jgi:hypothetical protein
MNKEILMKKPAILGMFVLLAVAPSLIIATAQQRRPSSPPAQFQYAVKFVCANAKGVTAQPGILVPGQYLTVINVHNPSNSSPVSFRKKVAVALPGEQAGPISPFFEANLKPDEALEIDCADIYDHASISPKQIAKGILLKGFVVIESPLELDVVAVYTAGGAQVGTLHTERVPARPIVACASLGVPLGTDTGNWMVVADPINPSVPRPATYVAMPTTAWAQPPGYQWVSASTKPDGTDDPGDYTYQICFCLCSDFQNANLSFTLLADNDAKVLLNNNPVWAISNAFGAPTGPPPITTQSLFRPGQNCLTVIVHNLGSFTGLALTGGVSADGIIICNPPPPIR